MKKTLLLLAGLFILCGTVVAQDESEGTVSVGIDLGAGIPRGDLKDAAKSGAISGIGLAWSTENYMATIMVGYDMFGKKVIPLTDTTSFDVKGKFYPITAGYYANVGKLASITPHVGAEFGAHLCGGDFVKSYFSLTPVLGASMEMMENLSVGLNVKYHMLLEDPGIQYWGVSVGVQYAIMK